MNVLVVNAGSSSLKYQLFDTSSGTVVAKGICERIGLDGGKITHKQLVKDKEYTENAPMPNHTEAMKYVVNALTDREHGCVQNMDEIQAVGHRIVHGGAFFSQSVLLNDDVLSKLELCRDLAPLHTGAHLQGINGCLEIMPKTPQVLVFDTAFHQSMPEKAYIYPVPYKMYKKYSIRRYGAHGTSHRYVAGEMINLLGGQAKGTKIITCHLGNGSSISAVKDGKVIDTSMGFTPLAGVIMGTRCGDMDPAIVPFIMEKEGYTPAQMNEFMNKECGFLGVSEVSSDCRDLVDASCNGNGQARLAMDILGYQIKKYIGSYAAAMNGLDAIVFTAGIGENTHQIRERALLNMEYFGIELDRKVNVATRGSSGKTRLSTDKSKVLVYMIPTNEELVIAQDTEKIVSDLIKK